MSLFHSLSTNVILLFSVLNTILLACFFFSGGYPTPLILIHFASILFFVGYIVYPSLSFENFEKYQKDIFILFILFLIAFSIRMYLLGSITPGMEGDEVAVAISSDQVFHIGYTPFIFNNYGHGTIIPYLVGISMHLFGKSLESIRLPSVLFGAFGICAFYILTRLFVQRSLAVFSVLLFTFSYAHFALSRVIYEPTASIFFEILSLIFLFLFLKKNDRRYCIGLGIVLALGNYTYLNFRLFTLAILLVLLIVQFVKKGPWKEKRTPLFITFIILFFSLVPLIHYSVVHPDHVTARIQVMSVFHQGLPLFEVIKNIWGNIAQLRFVFLPPGDPNTRINPAFTSMIDIGTTILFIIGCISLFKKNHLLLSLSIVFFLSFIFSDIFSYESGPANTFYGFAHPNTLRISGILPLIYFLAVFGIQAVKPKLDALGKTFYTVFFSFLIFVLGTYNMYLYFSQEYVPYTYAVNGVQKLDIVSLINTTPYTSVYISPTIAKDIRFTYFQKRFPTLHEQTIENTKQALQIIRQHQLTIIDVTKNLALAKDLVGGADTKLENIQRNYHKTTLGQIDTLIYIKQ